MADYPTDKTNAVDNVTDVLAKHINNLEDKVGIDNSADTNSIDYKLERLYKPELSDPGHVHTVSSISDLSKTGAEYDSAVDLKHAQAHAQFGGDHAVVGHYKMFYSNGAGVIQELAMGSTDDVLKCSGPSGYPYWDTESGGGGFDLTAKGGLHTYDGSTQVELAVGSNGKVLLADSTVSNGIKWGLYAPASTPSANNEIGRVGGNNHYSSLAFRPYDYPSADGRQDYVQLLDSRVMNGDNLCKNGHFETGLERWTWVDNGGTESSNSRITTHTDDFPVGKAGAKIESDSMNDCWLEQTIDITDLPLFDTDNNRTLFITVSGWIHGDSGAMSSIGYLSLAVGSTWYDSEGVSADSWEFVSKTIEVTADNFQSNNLKVRMYVLSGDSITPFIFSGIKVEVGVVPTEYKQFKPGDISCSVYSSSTQSIPNSSHTAVNFNSEHFDTDSMHDTSTNNSRITVKTAGKYMVVANIVFAFNATGQRQVQIRVNGSTYRGKVFLDANSATYGNRMNVSAILDLDVDDYVECVVWQNSGGSLNVVNDTSATFLSLVRIA